MTTTFHLQGLDLEETTYWTWFSTRADADESGLWTTPLDPTFGLLDRLLWALPGTPADVARLSRAELAAQVATAPLPAELRAHLSTPHRDSAWQVDARHALDLVRVAAADLCDRAAERELMTDLGALVLPPGLLAALRDAADRDDDPPRLVVLPPASLGLLPWSTLVVAGDERLCEVADVVTMAPALSRDGRTDLPHPAWADRRGGTAYVIDPDLPGIDRVLRPDDAAHWQRAYPEAAVQQPAPDQARLREICDAAAALLFVGHVESDRMPSDEVGLLLPDLGTDDGVAVPLTASRIVLDGWRWPPRVALVACRSGVDLSFDEPFGLVTAVLEGGAEVVLATSWPLFTDTAHAAMGQSDTPLLDLAFAAADILAAPDPVRALNARQREWLDRWRAGPSLATSPVTWAGLTLHHAPDRTPRAGSSTQPSTPSSAALPPDPPLAPPHDSAHTDTLTSSTKDDPR